MKGSCAALKKGQTIEKLDPVSYMGSSRARRQDSRHRAGKTDRKDCWRIKAGPPQRGRGVKVLAHVTLAAWNGAHRSKGGWRRAGRASEVSCSRRDSLRRSNLIMASCPLCPEAGSRWTKTAAQGLWLRWRDSGRMMPRGVRLDAAPHLLPLRRHGDAPYGRRGTTAFPRMGQWLDSNGGPTIRRRTESTQPRTAG